MLLTEPGVALENEAERLLRSLMYVDCEPRGRTWNLEACREIAPLTLEINRLKREKDAVILAHSYVEPEIMYGVADYRGDSYFLSTKAREVKASTIVFAGVRFMAETAKILSPHATVLVPDRDSGCSLADSMTGESLRTLKALYPDATVVCYVNSTADVKAESDVCVTSANVLHIVANLPAKRILFVPDRLMGANLRTSLAERGIRKEIITSDGTCMVHDQFSPADIAEARERYPDLKVVAHPECTPEVAAIADFVGSTGEMMKYVKNEQGAVLPDADRVRPGRPSAGRVAREGVHRRMPPVPVHEAELARKTARRAGRRAAAGPDHHDRRRRARTGGALSGTHVRTGAVRGMTLPPRTDHLIDLAIEEDAGLGDVTSRAIFPATHQSTAVIEAREPLVAAGVGCGGARLRARGRHGRASRCTPQTDCSSGRAPRSSR